MRVPGARVGLLRVSGVPAIPTLLTAVLVITAGMALLPVTGTGRALVRVIGVGMSVTRVTVAGVTVADVAMAGVADIAVGPPAAGPVLVSVSPAMTWEVAAHGSLSTGS